MHGCHSTTGLEVVSLKVYQPNQRRNRSSTRTFWWKWVIPIVYNYMFMLIFIVNTYILSTTRTFCWKWVIPIVYNYMFMLIFIVNTYILSTTRTFCWKWVIPIVYNYMFMLFILL